MADILTIARKLNDAGFARVRQLDARAITLSVNGARVEVRMARQSAAGWRINIHRHGVVDESSVDAYLIILQGPIGSRKAPLYLVFEAPVERSCFNFTFASVEKKYAENVEGWEILRSVVKKSRKAA